VGDDGSVRRWRLDGRLAAERRGQVGSIVSAAVSHDGKTLAIGGSSGDVALWRLPSLNLRHSFHAHDGRVAALNFGDADRFIVSGGWDGNIAIWSAAGDYLRRFVASDREISGVSLFPGTRLAASASYDGAVRILNIDTGAARTLTTMPRYVRRVQASPSGAFLVAGGASGELAVWSRSARFIPRRSIIGPNYEIWSIAFSPDSRYVAVGSRSDGDFSTLHLWDSVTRNLIAMPRAHYEYTLASCFIGNPTRELVTAGNDGIITIWDFARLLNTSPNEDWRRIRELLTQFDSVSVEQLRAEAARLRLLMGASASAP
jgi:WD40 repeat protein